MIAIPEELLPLLRKFEKRTYDFCKLNWEQMQGARRLTDEQLTNIGFDLKKEKWLVTVSVEGRKSLDHQNYIESLTPTQLEAYNRAKETTMNSPAVRLYSSR